MNARVKLAAVLLVAACGTRETRSVNPVTHACEVSAEPARPAVRRLVAAVDALDETRHREDHVALLAAMRALGDSLEAVAPGRTAELARVRTMTQALDRAVGNSDAHADFVRIGLVSAWHALEAVSPRQAGDGCYRTGLDSMIGAASRIAPEKRIAKQYAQIREALHAASAAVLAAQGGSTIATRTR